MEAVIHSIRSEVEKTIQNLMENVMAEVNKNTKGLRKELSKIQSDLQVVKASFDAQTNNLMEMLCRNRRL
jgi:hypothetical protein